MDKNRLHRYFQRDRLALSVYKFFFGLVNMLIISKYAYTSIYCNKYRIK